MVDEHLLWGIDNLLDDLTHSETALTPISDGYNKSGSSVALGRTPVELDNIASARPSSFGDPGP